MSTEKNDGGRAYPQAQFRGDEPVDTAEHGGMSLRDHFVGLAMQALIAKLPVVDGTGAHGLKLNANDKAQWMLDVALSAYDYADRMLKAREQ